MEVPTTLPAPRTWRVESFSHALMARTNTVVLIQTSVLLCSAAVLLLAAKENSRGESHDVFQDITKQSGIDFVYRPFHTSRKYLPETMGSGVALFDFDNDGRLDVFLVNGAPIADPQPPGSVPKKYDERDWNRLYRQLPDGHFEDVTQRAGLAGSGYGMGVAAGDFDNDGYEDLFVTAYGGNKLYHNNRDGTFSDVTDKAGVQGAGWSTSAAWVDLDGDGLLDLVVVRYLKWDFDDIWCGDHKAGYRAYCHPNRFLPESPLVYHNEGNGRFKEVAQESGLAIPGKGLGIAITDYNRDGHIDLIIADDSMAQHLYRNKGDGTFVETALSSGVATDEDGQTYAGMGVDASDYDNDGRPDIFIDDLANQKYALYRNDGNELFTYATNISGLGMITRLHSGWGVRFLDYDNDGWKDLLVAQGHDMDTIQLSYPNLRYSEHPLLMRNENGRFVDMSSAAGEAFQHYWVARGLAIGDIDNDGRVDAIVTTNEGPVHLLRNQSNTGNHWLTVQLVGRKSNRDGIGAEVQLTTAKAIQYATVTTAGSYLSSSDKRVHFGLGNETKILSVVVRWPSGIIQHLTSPHCDQLLKVTEHAD